MGRAAALAVMHDYGHYGALNVKQNAVTSASWNTPCLLLLYWGPDMSRKLILQ